MQSVKYYLSDHPKIINFRWSPTQTWFSTWSFLFTTIILYFLSSLALHLLLSLLFRHRRSHRVLRPILATHSLIISLSSLTVFIGTLISAAAEIQDTRWLLRSTHLKTSPLQWLLCFPIGTRPSGRVFFWSYVFYLYRFLHLSRTFLKIIRRRRLSFFHLFNQSFMLCMAFLWLEFSQSFQVVAILLMTAVNGVVYGYRFWTGVGLPAAEFPLVMDCQAVLLGCNLVCHVGVLTLHIWKGGCNGIGAWCFNSVCNGVILMMFLKKIKRGDHLNEGSSHYPKYRTLQKDD